VANVVLALVKVVLALVAGYFVLWLLHPSIHTSTDPPTCSTLLGWSVTCNAWPAWIAAGATVVVVGFALLSDEGWYRALTGGLFVLIALGLFVPPGGIVVRWLGAVIGVGALLIFASAFLPRLRRLRR
jgi:hypothetical protein